MSPVMRRETFGLTAALGMLSAAASVTTGSAAVRTPAALRLLVSTAVSTVTVLFERPIALRHLAMSGDSAAVTGP
jgi:hypothetical protein